MSELLIGYERVSTDAQDFTAQRDALQALGVPLEPVYGVAPSSALPLPCHADL